MAISELCSESQSEIAMSGQHRNAVDLICYSRLYLSDQHLHIVKILVNLFIIVHALLAQFLCNGTCHRHMNIGRSGIKTDELFRSRKINAKQD
jgi:hypothetical protein